MPFGRSPATHKGIRATKKVTTNGEVTLHQRYIYRGYLQIAACDLTRTWQPALWYILWDPTQPVATRPLAIHIIAVNKDNKTELYSQKVLISDILKGTKGRRIAEAHLMQCYSFNNIRIVAEWKKAAIIAKGFTRMNVCGINMIFT